MTNFVGPLVEAELQNVTLQITSVTATQIGFNYHTPNGNLPNTNGNSVYIWQAGDRIPWQTDAESSRPISGNSPDGSSSFDRLDVTNRSYVIGYAVGPIDAATKWSKYANCVAQAFIPAIGKGAKEYASSSLSVSDIGSTSLVADYTFLEGFDPQGSGAWAGMWVGRSVSNSTPPKYASPIDGSNSEGTVSFNNIKLTRGTTYTIGLYATGHNSESPKLKLTALAFALTFKNE